MKRKGGWQIKRVQAMASSSYLENPCTHALAFISTSRYSSLEGEAIKSNYFHTFEVFFVCDFVSVVIAGRGVSWPKSSRM